MSYGNPMHGLDSSGERIQRPDYRIIVTGTREDLTAEQAGFLLGKLTVAMGYAVAHELRPVLVHGKCHTGGVDRAVERWAESAGVPHEPHPADWSTYGRKAGPIRNAEMVALGAAICLAFPIPGSRGTWDCLQKAADAGIPGRVYPLPTGNSAGPTKGNS
jgi:hypothetical protein